MKTIRAAIAEKNQEGSAALIPYIMLGDPDFETTAQVIRTLSKAGAAVIELGVPFTDPIADGPVIQKATERALQNPFSFEAIFDFVKKLRNEGEEIPIAIYSYSNLIFNLGYDVFCQKANEAGIQGTLIVDLPPEEAEDFMGPKNSENSENLESLETIFLCSPTTSPERLALVNAASTGFTYYVARKGVTGMRSDLPEGVAEKFNELRKVITTPLAVGFGISEPQHAQAFAQYADAVVIGSAYVNMFERLSGGALLKEIEDFTASVVTALSKNQQPRADLESDLESDLGSDLRAPS